MSYVLAVSWKILVLEYHGKTEKRNDQTIGKQREN